LPWSSARNSPQDARPKVLAIQEDGQHSYSNLKDGYHSHWESVGRRFYVAHYDVAPADVADVPTVESTVVDEAVDEARKTCDALPEEISATCSHYLCRSDTPAIVYCFQIFSSWC
jgi:hypothetical protein